MLICYDICRVIRVAKIERRRPQYKNGRNIIATGNPAILQFPISLIHAIIGMERGAIADMQQAETSKKVKVSKLIIAVTAAAILIGAGVLTAILIKNKISSVKNRTNPVLSISHCEPLNIDDHNSSPAGAF
ncbi:MAG: hypothetical protein J6X19_02965, partial [Clostridia bacterium]|nr:hypothetical protein [Clostridia bacterium]